MKVLKNFSCNGVRKKIGDILTEEECKIIGELGKGLIANDFLQKGTPLKEVKKEVKEVKEVKKVAKTSKK